MSRFLHELAHGMVLYRGRTSEKQRSGFNPLADTNWAYTWAWPIVSFVVTRYGRRSLKSARETRPKAVALEDLARFERLVAANPGQIAAGLWLEYVGILEQLGRYEAAIAVYGQAITRDSLSTAAAKN